MEIKVVRCKQYSSTYKSIVMVNGNPICIVRGSITTSNIISYLNGYDVPIEDGKIKKKLDELRCGKE